jgi:hypothetical protein
LTLKMEVACSSEMLLSTYRTWSGRPQSEQLLQWKPQNL